MKLFEDIQALNDYYETLKSEAVAPVSKATPLLSNLSVIENIALINEVHLRLPYGAAKRSAEEALEKTGFSHIGALRSAECSEHERFIAQLIRASMMQYAKIVIITPFILLNETEDVYFLLQSCEKLQLSERCIFLDFTNNRTKYEQGGPACRIVE